jgi:RNA polymerase sigma-70 factor (ECF subfamily)
MTWPNPPTSKFGRKEEGLELRGDQPIEQRVRTTTLDDRSDAELVRRVRAGSPEGLAELYRRHSEMVYHVAYRFLTSEDDAEDVLQDVFAGLPEALRAYQERDRFEFWLKRVAVRAALMLLRSRERRREERLPEARAPRSQSPDAETVAKYVATRRALRQLTPDQRVVLILKQVEGYTHAEIGELLGISEAASAGRLHRALRKLWELLGEREEGR